MHISSEEIQRLTDAAELSKLFFVMEEGEFLNKYLSPEDVNECLFAGTSNLERIAILILKLIRRDSRDFYDGFMEHFLKKSQQYKQMYFSLKYGNPHSTREISTQTDLGTEALSSSSYDVTTSVNDTDNLNYEFPMTTQNWALHSISQDGTPHLCVENDYKNTIHEMSSIARDDSNDSHPSESEFLSQLIMKREPDLMEDWPIASHSHSSVNMTFNKDGVAALRVKYKTNGTRVIVSFVSGDYESFLYAVAQKLNLLPWTFQFITEDGIGISDDGSLTYAVSKDSEVLVVDSNANECSMSVHQESSSSIHHNSHVFRKRRRKASESSNKSYDERKDSKGMLLNSVEDDNTKSNTPRRKQTAESARLDSSNGLNLPGSSPNHLAPQKSKKTLSNLEMTTILTKMKTTFSARLLQCRDLNVEERVALYPDLMEPFVIYQEAILNARELAMTSHGEYCAISFEISLPDSIEVETLKMYNLLRNAIVKYKSARPYRNMQANSKDMQLKLGLIFVALRLSVNVETLFSPKSGVCIVGEPLSDWSGVNVNGLFIRTGDTKECLSVFLSSFLAFNLTRSRQYDSLYELYECLLRIRKSTNYLRARNLLHILA